MKFISKSLLLATVAAISISSVKADTVATPVNMGKKAYDYAFAKGGIAKDAIVNFANSAKDKAAGAMESVSTKSSDATASVKATAVASKDAIVKWFTAGLTSVQNSEFVKNRITPLVDRANAFYAAHPTAIKVTAGVTVATVVGYVVYKKFFASQEEESNS